MSTCEYYTPDIILAPARQVLGNIDLDPASCEAANKHVQAAKYYDLATDGLNESWHGKVFLNPPYDRVKHWIDHLFYQWNAENLEAAIIVTRAAVETTWFQLLWDWPVCFPAKRINFMPGVGQTATGNTYPTAITYVGHNQRRFATEFRTLGQVRWPGKLSDLQ